MPATNASPQYTAPTASVPPERARTPYRYWFGILVTCTLASLAPTLAVEARLGLPTFKGAVGDMIFLSFAAYCAVLVAFAVLGVFFVTGRRIPVAVFLGLSALPGCVGFVGWDRILAGRERLQSLNAQPAWEALSSVLHVARTILGFGLATSACAFVVVLVAAILAHRAALVRFGLDSHPLREEGSGRVVASVVVAACSGLAPLFLEHDMIMSVRRQSGPWFSSPVESAALAIVATCALGSVGAGLVASRIRLLAMVQDERERGWLWRRAALLPISAALAVVCFEMSLFFSGTDWASGPGAASIEGAVVLIAVGMPLFLAKTPLTAAVRTLGVPFALSCAVVLGEAAGLLVPMRHLSATQAEIARLGLAEQVHR